ncbi:MAG: HD family phosphohydrolase [Candidatus Tyloplasma litorale]|nr:MAG: HD family phosphohydrolase [Mycoplasmatales bacterium]
MKIKYIADSILNGITINDELILKLYEAKELRRLARVNHLGIVHFLYPMAKHYRFEHSLGVYELTRRMLEKLNPNIDKATYRAVMAAGLLHDLGHGPYSHLFELISPKDHEEYSIDIILDPSTDVYKAFEEIEPSAREQVVQILKGEHPLQWCNQLISSEVDMDRLDYLLRDSTSTGAAYGQIDWRWLLKNARIHQNQLVFKEKALTVIESLLLGRYHMNIAVYWNPKTVANQMLYKGWFNRMSYLKSQNKLISTYKYLDKILDKKEMTVEEFINVDDSIVNSAVRYSMEEEDEIIKKIANKFINQIQPETIFGEKNVKTFISKQDKDLKGQTWEIIDIATDFNDYQKNHKFPSLILTNDNQVVQATKYSSVINDNPNEKRRVKRLGVKII